MQPRLITSGVLLVACLALVLGACGGSSPARTESPVAPTAQASPTPTPSTGSATVSGTVAVSSGPTGFTAYSQTSTSSGVTVSVAGTAIQTITDGSGRFTLNGVPSGTVQLKFSGGGMEGSITLSGVKDADRIDIDVTLSASGASLTKAEEPGGLAQLEGRVAAINPGGAANTLLVDSTTVSVPAGAVIRHGDTPVAFSDLKVGDRVHVKGTQNGQAIVATEVIVQNTNPSVPVNATGAVSLLQAGFSCPAIRFTLGGWIIETSSATSFEKGSCSSIVNGASVHVKGDVQSSGRVLATWVQIQK